MASKHYTALGHPIDMSALASRHANTVALGNAKMNARGDILGNNGVVLRTQEQIEEEWRREQERRDASSRAADMPSQDIKAPLPQMAGKKLTDDQDFDPSAPPSSGQQRRRKMVDTD